MPWQFWQSIMPNTAANPSLAHLQSWIAQECFPQALALEMDAATEAVPLASTVARALLCHEHRAQDCACRSCTLLSEGTHPDAHWFLDKAVGIDEVRQITRLNSLSATLGRGRLICLAEVEHLNLNAANALLKTLEEPNPGVHFLLFTRNFDSILPTIQSRVRFVSCRREAEHFQAYWATLCRDEKAGVFLQDFFSLMQREKLPSELAQLVQSQGLLQGLEWLYLAFMALLWDSSMQQRPTLTPAGLCTRYPFERYIKSIERIKEISQLVKKGAALQPLLTIEAILVPYIA